MLPEIRPVMLTLVLHTLVLDPSDIMSKLERLERREREREREKDTNNKEGDETGGRGEIG